MTASLNTSYLDRKKEGKARSGGKSRKEERERKSKTAPRHKNGTKRAAGNEEKEEHEEGIPARKNLSSAPTGLILKRQCWDFKKKESEKEEARKSVACRN